MTDTPDEEFYRRAAAALERASEAAEDQVHATDNLAHEINTALEAIDNVLPSLPTRAEVEAGRHRTVVRIVFAVIWLTIAAAWLSAEYSRGCSPGARTARIADVLLHDGFTVEQLRAQGRRPLPTWCDVAYPADSHDPLGSWPSPENIAGIALFAGFAVVTIAAVRPRPPKERTDH